MVSYITATKKLHDMVKAYGFCLGDELKWEEASEHLYLNLLAGRAWWPEKEMIENEVAGRRAADTRKVRHDGVPWSELEYEELCAMDLRSERALGSHVRTLSEHNPELLWLAASAGRGPTAGELGLQGLLGMTPEERFSGRRKLRTQLEKTDLGTLRPYRTSPFGGKVEAGILHRRLWPLEYAAE